MSASPTEEVRDDSSYADRAACSGAKPAYCESTSHASSKACSGPGQPTTSQIIEAARRMGLSLDVSLLMDALSN